MIDGLVDPEDDTHCHPRFQGEDRLLDGDLPGKGGRDERPLDSKASGDFAPVLVGIAGGLVRSLLRIAAG